MEKSTKSKKKIIIISIISVLLAIPLIILPVTTVIVYESIFGERYETASWLEFSVEDYEGLQMERSDFQSEDVTLAGYKYSKADQEVKGAVVIAHGLGGGGHNTYMPYLKLYERIKFGEEFTAVSALKGLERTEAGIMVVHSKDDSTVPTKYGYDKFYEAFGNSDRFEFVLYGDKGHDYLFYSEAAWAYREQLNADYKSYVEDNGREYNAETKEEFMNGYLDKKQCFEPNPILMEQILNMFDTYCAK